MLTLFGVLGDVIRGPALLSQCPIGHLVKDILLFCKKLIPNGSTRTPAFQAASSVSETNREVPACIFLQQYG